MKSILSLVKVDLKIIIKNVFFWVLIGTLVGVILVVNCVLPKELRENTADIITYGFEKEGYKRAKSLDELSGFVKQNKNAAGIALVEGKYKVYASNLSNRQATAVTLPFLERSDKKTNVVISQATNTSNTPPFNKRCLPIFICFEAVVQGFLLAGVLMLNEKSGKTIRALRVAPISVFHYWTAKILLFSVLGSLYAMFMALFTVGFRFPVIPFILVSMIASAMFTMLGMITAAFFRSMNNWFMMAALILGINMLTMFAYVFPSLSIPVMRIIPSYSIIFTYENILFGSLKLHLESASIIMWLFVLSIGSIVCIKLKYLLPQKGGR